MDNHRPTTSQPQDTKNKGLFRPGHPYYPRKHPQRPSIRQQRKAQAEKLADLIAEMSEQHDAGQVIDPIAYATLLNAHRRLLKESA
jgi:hypothetical protein